MTLDERAAKLRAIEISLKLHGSYTKALSSYIRAFGEIPVVRRSYVYVGGVRKIRLQPHVVKLKQGQVICSFQRKVVWPWTRTFLRFGELREITAAKAETGRIPFNLLIGVLDTTYSKFLYEKLMRGVK